MNNDHPPQRWPQQVTCKVCDMRVTNPLLEQWEEGKRSGFIVSVVCGPCRADMGGGSRRRRRAPQKAVTAPRRTKTPQRAVSTPKQGVDGGRQYGTNTQREVDRIMGEIDAELDAEHGPKETPTKRLVLDDY